jgi:hypothetical protein
MIETEGVTLFSSSDDRTAQPVYSAGRYADQKVGFEAKRGDCRQPAALLLPNHSPRECVCPSTMSGHIRLLFNLSTHFAKLNSTTNTHDCHAH